MRYELVDQILFAAIDWFSVCITADAAPNHLSIKRTLTKE